MTDPLDPNPPFEAYSQPIAYDPNTFAFAPAPPPYSGYPGQSRYPTGAERPGAVVAASTLALVGAALLIMAGLLLLAGVSLNSALRGADTIGDAFWLGLACVVNFASGGLAIAGAVQLLARRPVARPMLCAAATVDIAASIGWLTQGGMTLFFVAICAGPVVVAAALTWQRTLWAWIGAVGQSSADRPSEPLRRGTPQARNRSDPGDGQG